MTFICKHGYGLYGSILNNYFLKKRRFFFISEAYVSGHYGPAYVIRSGGERYALATASTWMSMCARATFVLKQNHNNIAVTIILNIFLIIMNLMHRLKKTSNHKM
jgi:hypothetical protein